MSKESRVEKNLALSADFNSYLMKNPNVMGKLPNKICIVFEVKNDKSLSQANLKVAEELSNKKGCFVASKSGSRWSLRPLAV
jgi:hypothetical protein